MPRYFFNVHDGFDIPDREGVEIATAQKLKEESVRFAGALIADRAKIAKFGEDWMMEVIDETGLILFRLDFQISNTAATAALSAKSKL